MAKHILGFLLIMLMFDFMPLSAQVVDEDGSLVKWISIEEAVKLSKIQPKPLLVDFYTDWCGWCKKMMKTTYANPDLAAYINNNFYPVKFNAEGPDTIEYLGKKYAPVGDGPRKTNELAIKLLQGKLMYPTTLFMNGFDKTKNEFQFSMLAGGYLESQKLEPILIFTLENVFRNSSYDEYNNQFQQAFFDTSTNTKLKEVKWLSPKEAFDHQEKRNKKLLVYINTDWCNSCKVMKRTAFINDSTAKYIRQKFDLVDFNPESDEPIFFKGNNFGNAKKPESPFHQLSVALCKGNFTLPSLAILDENMNLVDVIPYFIQDQFMTEITKYYGDDIYKTKTWKDYRAEIKK